MYKLTTFVGFVNNISNEVVPYGTCSIPSLSNYNQLNKNRLEYCNVTLFYYPYPQTIDYWQPSLAADSILHSNLIFQSSSSHRFVFISTPRNSSASRNQYEIMYHQTCSCFQVANVYLIFAADNSNNDNCQ